MSLHTWWLFVATVFVVSAIPGPNMLLVMTSSAQHGLRRASATMAGCLSALVLMLAVSAAGLGVFLQAWPAMFDALRLIGAGYLVYLAWKMWRAPVATGRESLPNEHAPLKLFAAGPISGFVERHPTVKMLALSFLMLIGMALIAEGLEFHIPKGYIYFAMGFSVFVELLNIRLKGVGKPVKLHDGYREDAKA